LTPTFNFTDVNPGKEDITFEYTVNDTDVVGSLTKIELLKAQEVIETLTQFEDTSFSDLLSNNDYQLKATYTYDLNDGAGVQTLEQSANTKTLTKVKPVVLVPTFYIQNNQFNYQLDITNIDNLELIITVGLFHNNIKIDEVINPSNYMFIGSIDFNQYTLKVSYSYNLNDGKKDEDKVIYRFHHNQFDLVEIGQKGVVYENL
jgi:hypothetical protein